MLRCWLIRHGESEANAGLPTADTKLIGLTPRGFEQAKQIALAFEEEPTLIVSSPYLRAQQTVQATTDRFRRVPYEEWPVQEFTYLALAPDHLMTYGQRLPMAQAYWSRCDPLYVDGPGAESFSNLMCRARNFLQQLAELRDGAIAVFSHGLFIRAVLWSLLCGQAETGSNVMALFRLFLDAVPFPNGAFIDLQYSNNGGSSLKLTLGGIVTSHLSPTPIDQ